MMLTASRSGHISGPSFCEKPTQTSKIQRRSFSVCLYLTHEVCDYHIL